MAAAGEPKLAGVGIYFQDANGEVVVNHIITGGSADRSGIIQLGDVVVSIDSKDVRGKPLQELRSSFVGAEGSNVTLGFERGQNREPFVIQLVFGSPEFIAAIDKSSKKPVGTTASADHAAVPAGTAARPVAGAAEHDTGSAPRGATRDAEIRRLEEALKSEAAKVRVQERLRVEAEEALRRLSVPGPSDQVVRLEQALRIEREGRMDEERRRQDAERRLELALQKGGGGGGGGGGGTPGRTNQDFIDLQERLAAADSKVRQLQQQLEEAQGRARRAETDLESREAGRLAMIAVPHLISHVQAVAEVGGALGGGGSDAPGTPPAAGPTPQPGLGGLAAVSVAMVQLLDVSCSRCMRSVPQSVPQLVSLLATQEPSTVREASLALALTSLTAGGRTAILQVPVGPSHLVSLLASQDVETRRHCALALGNLAMDPTGRRGLLGVFSLLGDLAQALRDTDLDCRRGAAMALGNLLTEAEARESLLPVVAAARSLAEQLKSPDRLLVRYATGALRNLAVDDRGRRTLLANQEAVAALKGLLSSPDRATARFAESALHNLSMAPAASPDLAMAASHRGGGSGGAGLAAPSPGYFGLPVPFFDSDGLGVPNFISAK